jgi:hypothetical protein
VELGALVPLRPPQVVLGLARAELPEVLRCLGHHVGEELELDPPQWFSWSGVSWWDHVRGEKFLWGDGPPTVMSKKTLGSWCSLVREWDMYSGLPEAGRMVGGMVRVV